MNEVGVLMPRTIERSNNKQRLSKAVWMEKTLEKIGEVGVASIQVELLARELGVTKGSFYWHFKDKQELIREALVYWYDSATRLISQAAKRNFDDPRDRLRYVYKLALNIRYDVPGGAVERALQEWARISTLATEITQRVDQERISFLADAYIELGHSELEARQTATLALAQLTGINVLLRSQPNRDRSEYLRAIITQFICQKN